MMTKTKPLTKHCYKCLEIKPIEDFPKHSKMSDGHLNKCTLCARKDAKMYRELRIDYWRAVDRVRAKTRERCNNQSEDSRNRKAEWQREYRKNFPEKYKAHQKVKRALENGKLAKTACFVCGNLEVEAHHPSYSLPLDVVWLCTKHHGEVHSDYSYVEDLHLINLVS